MGYTTDFYGEWVVDPPLAPEHREYLLAFSHTRRMKRDAAKAELLPDPIREAAKLPIGLEGAYYVGGHGKNMGQDGDPSVLDNNEPPGIPSMPRGDLTAPMKDFNERYQSYVEAKKKAIEIDMAQPGLWCSWEPNEEGTAIRWSGAEKFYDYIEWISYLLAHFLIPWGYTLNGEVEWQGEERDDMGRIDIVDNVVTVREAHITWK